ncbi:MAG: hypothetical protein AAF558_06395 [Verrucomicrobiota bacterium]
MSEAVETLEPSLGVAFPIKTQGQTVLVERSILLNKERILPAGTLLRVCFQPPEQNDKDVRRKETRNNLENTFSRKPIKVSSRDQEYNAYYEALKDRAFATVWTDPNLFRGYFHKIDYDRYFLVYQEPGEEEPKFAKFFFPEGLFLSSNEGIIEVLAIKTGSRAMQAGFKAGDKIYSFEGTALEGNLKTFITSYIKAQQTNPLTGKPLRFMVSTTENPEPHERNIRLPLSINSDPFAPVN